MTTIDRRSFLRRSAILGGGLAAMGPLHALGARVALGDPPPRVTGYGPLVPKGDLALPAQFNYQIISRQGLPQRDGTPTPGIFDAMGAFRDTRMGAGTPGDTTILIRNHENRERPGEIKVVTGPGFEYDETAFGGCTKLVVRQKRTPGPQGDTAITYEVIDSFNIIGGTSTNCAGGVIPFEKWITCEEVVKRSPNGKKHGYNFEVNAMADGPVVAAPILAAGRFVHEATIWRSGILYETEDRSITADPLTQKRLLGSCFYRYIPDQRVGQSGNLAETTGPLQALKLKNEFHANMDTGRVVGAPYPVEWVTVPQADHDDDTDNRRDRVPGFTPTRVQAQDLGAAFFDREEGMWTGVGDSKVYFDCTTGGAQNLGQVWEYDPGREVITLIYESVDRNTLENPDNVVIVPQTGDIFLQEDSPGEQYIRGLTQDGSIYDFALALTNDTEFCGGCFDPDGQTLYVNQQGERGGGVDGPPEARATTYAIYGPFEKREGDNSKNFGNGPSR